jgi:4-hydroxybenzoate polyprenyltransferase
MGEIINSSGNPIIVDLDGTLIRSDILIESINLLVTKRPQHILGLIKNLFLPREKMKSWLAEKLMPDVSQLPYNIDLLEWLIQEKNKGRVLILATATHLDVANSIADHLGIFREVLASDAGRNLKAESKRDEITARFGPSKFEYVGNEYADMSVWKVANVAHIVSENKSLISKVQEVCKTGLIFKRSNKSVFATWISALRIHQWSKNLLVFVPLLTGHAYSSTVSVSQAVVAFFLFGVAASSIYLLNDLFDIEADRHHPTKKNRPIANGEINLFHAWLVWPSMLTFSVVLAIYALPIAFVAVMAGYIILTLTYTMFFKKWVFFDVLVLAILYCVRIIGGAFAVALNISFWLLLFSMFVFLSLALMKRFSELKVIKTNDTQNRLLGRGYLLEDLEVIGSMGICAGYISVLVLALYLQDPQIIKLYEWPQQLWVMCPLMLFWISRAWLLTNRGLMNDDPIVFALRDGISWMVGFAMVAVLIIARGF